MGHATMENRHGLAVAGLVTHATGTAERRASELMLKAKAKATSGRITMGAQSGRPSHSKKTDRKTDNSARKLLSFDWTSTRKRASVVAKGPAMDANTLAPALMTQLALMRERLDQAASLGQAAEACGKAGNISKAIEIARLRHRTTDL